MKLTEHFDSDEFSDPTEPGSGNRIDLELVNMLEQIREECGFPFHITSGVRSPSHNKDVGGKPDSAHLTGNAADIAAPTDGMRYKIVMVALKHGIRRIGVKKDAVHLDNSQNLAQDVCWTYD